MITFDFTSCIDKFYPYRTALLQASIWITLDEQGKQHLRKYLERNHIQLDNHICWRNNDGMCYMYSDSKLGIGLEIVEENW